MKRALQALVSLGIGLVALGLAWRDTRVEMLLPSLVNINMFWLVISATSVLMVALVKAARWQIMFDNQPSRPSYAALFSAMIIGQTSNVMLPFRVGELVRAYILKRRANVAVALGLGTVVSEKLADLLLFGVGALVLPILAAVPDSVRTAAVSVLLIAIILVVATQWCASHPAWLAALERWLPARLQGRAHNIAVDMLAGWSVLWTSGIRLRLWTWSLGIWLLSVVAPAALARAMGWALPWTAVLTLVLALQASFILPSPPGIIGVVQYISVLVLPLYGIGQTAAFAYGLWLNGVLVIPLLLCSLIVWVFPLGYRRDRVPSSLT